MPVSRGFGTPSDIIPGVPYHPGGSDKITRPAYLLTQQSFSYFSVEAVALPLGQFVVYFVRKV